MPVHVVLTVRNKVINTGRSSIFHVSPSGGRIVFLRNSLYDAMLEAATRTRVTLPTSISFATNLVDLWTCSSVWWRALVISVSLTCKVRIIPCDECNYSTPKCQLIRITDRAFLYVLHEAPYFSVIDIQREMAARLSMLFHSVSNWLMLLLVE